MTLSLDAVIFSLSVFPVQLAKYDMTFFLSSSLLLFLCAVNGKLTVFLCLYLCSHALSENLLQLP